MLITLHVVLKAIAKDIPVCVCAVSSVDRLTIAALILMPSVQCLLQHQVRMLLRRAYNYTISGRKDTMYIHVVSSQFLGYKPLQLTNADTL